MILFALLLLAVFFLLLGLPILAMVDALTTEEGGGRRKILAVALIVALWPAGSLLYAIFLTRRLGLRLVGVPLLLASAYMIWIGHQNAAREEATETADLEKYSGIAETGRLGLTAAFGSYGPPGNDDYVQALALSADGSRLAVSGGRTLKLWDVEVLRPLATFEQLPANDILAGWLQGRWLGRGDEVAISPDGEMVAAYQGSLSVKLWAGLFPLARDLFDGRGRGVVRLFSTSRDLEIRAHRSNVSAMAFLPDGRRLLTASYDGTLALWNAETGEDLLTIEAHPGWIQDVAVSPDGAQAISGAHAPLVGRDFSHVLSLWDLSTGTKKLDLVGHEDEVHAVGFAAGGAKAVSASYDGTIRVWDLATGREIRSIDAGRVSYRVAFSSDGRYALSGGETVHLWDLESGELLDRIPLGASGDEAAASIFAPSGKFLIVGTTRGALLRFDWK